jgi:anthranilate synthase component 1
VRGRYSIIGLKPDVIWECRGGAARINRTARYDPDGLQAVSAPPLDSLRALLAESRIDLPADMPPRRPGCSAISATT